MSSRMSGAPDRSLVAQLARYGSQHAHPLNRALHTLLDPLASGLALALLDLVAYPGGVSVGVFAFACLVTYWLHHHRLGGLLTSALVGGAMWLGLGLMDHVGELACLQLWVALTLVQQLVGHKLLEGGAPAYVRRQPGLSRFESWWESTATGMLYWPLHMLFAVGVDPELAGAVREVEARLRGES